MPVTKSEDIKFIAEKMADIKFREILMCAPYLKTQLEGILRYALYDTCLYDVNSKEFQFDVNMVNFLDLMKILAACANGRYRDDSYKRGVPDVGAYNVIVTRLGYIFEGISPKCMTARVYLNCISGDKGETIGEIIKANDGWCRDTKRFKKFTNESRKPFAQIFDAVMGPFELNNMFEEGFEQNVFDRISKLKTNTEVA